MRICLFTPTFLPMVGGAERDADLIARQLTLRGHDVRVLARECEGPEPVLPYRVHRYRRPPMQHLFTRLLARPLVKLHQSWPFEVVLAFYGYPNGYAASLVKESLGFGLVVSPRGGDLHPNYHDLRKPRVARLIAEGYRRADRIVSISQWLTQRIREVAGEKLPPIDLVYNGVDLAAFDAEIAASSAAPPPSPPTMIEKPFVLHLGGVKEVKRQDLAVQAVQRLRAEFERRGMKYAIVGEGNGAEQIRKMIAEYNLGHVVKMLGVRTGLEKAWLLDNARFMVSTSREEGLGNVVLEAMAAGLPMLGSDIGPHRELIGTRGWGMLFTSGDVEDLAKKLLAMFDADLAPLRQRALAERMHFTLDASTDGYERACRAALPRGRARFA